MDNAEIRDFIDGAIKENEVMLFMKGTPEQLLPAASPCASSGGLNALGVRYAALDILPDPRIREELSALSGWPTIPQLFVKGELVGGCDIVVEMYENGELAELLGADMPEEDEALAAAEPASRPAAEQHPPENNRGAERRSPAVASPAGSAKRRLGKAARAAAARRAAWPSLTVPEHGESTRRPVGQSSSASIGRFERAGHVQSTDCLPGESAGVRTAGSELAPRATRRPANSQVEGFTSMCCVATAMSRWRRCSGLDSYTELPPPSQYISSTTPAAGSRRGLQARRSPARRSRSTSWRSAACSQASPIAVST